MSGKNVGSVRPSQLIYTYGVGSTVDLPQFSARVMGLDDWPAGPMEEIREDRLLRAVRQVLGGQVRHLKAAPLEDDAPGPLFKMSSGEGVPVAAFPRWLVCTQCRLLAPIRSGLYEFRSDSARGALPLYPQELPAPRFGHGDSGALSCGMRKRPHRRFPMERVPPWRAKYMSRSIGVARRGRERRGSRRHGDMPGLRETQAFGSRIFRRRKGRSAGVPWSASASASGSA